MLGKLYIPLCLLCVIFFTSCSTSHKATTHYTSKSKFIDDIYLDRHNKSHSHDDGIDKTVKIPGKKHTSKKSGTSETAAANTSAPSKNLREKYANMLGVSDNDLHNGKLYKFVDEWYGVHYHMGGLDKNGIDCSGFALKLYEEVFHTELVHSSSDQYGSCEHVKKTNDLQEGDLVFFITRGKHISHVGVYLTNDYFVHASTNQGVTISSLKDAYYSKHFAGAGKVHKG